MTPVKDRRLSILDIAGVKRTFRYLSLFPSRLCPLTYYYYVLYLLALLYTPWPI